MTRSLLTTSLAARLGFAALATLAASTASVSAQEGVAFKNLMGNMGILPKEKDPIRYRERAPLVVPPRTELRPPVETYAASNPEWPNDPDVAARRRRIDEERRPVTWSETRRMSDNNARLSPEEMRQGRVARNGAPVPGSPGTHRGDNARDVLVLSPEQMAAGRKQADDDEVVPGAEPVRKVLSDPPSGMRRSATGKVIVGATAAPKVDQQALDANPMNWLTRKFTGSSDDE